MTTHLRDKKIRENRTVAHLKFPLIHFLLPRLNGLRSLCLGYVGQILGGVCCGRERISLGLVHVLNVAVHHGEGRGQLFKLLAEIMEVADAIPNYFLDFGLCLSVGQQACPTTYEASSPNPKAILHARSHLRMLFGAKNIVDRPYPLDPLARAGS